MFRASNDGGQTFSDKLASLRAMSGTGLNLISEIVPSMITLRELVFMI